MTDENAYEAPPAAENVVEQAAADIPAPEQATAPVDAVTSDAPAPVVTPPPAPTPAPGAPVAGAPAQWPSAGYAPPAAAPGTYPPAGYAYQQAPTAQTSSNAVIAIILAALSWAFCPIIAAIVALIFAHQASKEIEASGGRIQGQGLVTASRWVAWINIGLTAAIIVIGGFVLLLVAIAGGMSSN